MRSSAMRRFPGSLPSEVADFAEEVRQAFLELSRVYAMEPVSQCSPAIDVYERDGSIDVVVDLPGVDPAALRVLAKGDTLLIVGEKTARQAQPDSSFHLVERDFGRFARAVRLASACNTAETRARFVNGELHITTPKIPERRGRTIPVAVEQS